MFKFTQVNIRQGTAGLSRSKGFWSGKDVYFNNDESTIYVLDEKTTTQNLLDAINGTIDTGIRDWVKWDLRKNLELLSNGKSVLRHVFKPVVAPDLTQKEWVSSHGVSFKNMVKCWQNNGRNFDQLCDFLADQWVKAWRNDSNFYPSMHYGMSSEIALAQLLFIRWDRLDGAMPLERFLQDIWNLTALDMSGEHLLGPGRQTYEIINRRKNYEIIRDGLHREELEILIRGGLGVQLEGRLTVSKIRTILLAPRIACHALVLLAEKGLIIPPRNLGGRPCSCIVEQGWWKPFERWDASQTVRYRTCCLLISSTLRNLEDFPADLREHISADGHQSPHIGYLRRILRNYGETNGLPTFPLTSLERCAPLRIDADRKKWRPQWFRDTNRSEDWCSFADAAFASSKGGIKDVACFLQSFCEWALECFESPWVIRPTDLLNPFDPKRVDTFAAFCKKEAAAGSMHPGFRWSRAVTLFKRVVNVVSIPGYPYYREGTANPFEKLVNPFYGRYNSGGKTHRSRISSLIHERLIEVLLASDEQGKPTFAWAKTQFISEDSSPDRVWCPSRWTLLAILLLLPLRKAQARWLDQGLMDEKVFDPKTFKLVKNTHSLRSYTYENGQTHMQRYGRPSGVIQPMSDAFMGVADHIGLFINTNKTQLWNLEKKNGYELPWPDACELIKSDNPELRQHGYWLRRVYEVLAYQYHYVVEHDPNPEPIGFEDVIKDSGRVPVDEERKSMMPRFVPLFREPFHLKQVVRNGKLLDIAAPVTDAKISAAYTALCMEVENRLMAEGHHSISLTLPKESKFAPKTGVHSRNTKYDIHCLRVAGISRLIESGINPVIVQEFVAGHLTPAMTLHYFIMQPWHVRERFIQAVVNGDFKSAMETFAEKVAKGEWDREKTFVGLPRYQDHAANLPEDFACFAVVKGGICVMGGKGDTCKEGGVYEREDGEVEFGPVQGGCGNCLYFRTAAFLIQEQALVLNVLLVQLRAQARERKSLRTKICDLECQIDEVTGAESKSLISDKHLHQARIEEINHDMVPMLTEWVNRYIMLRECEAQLDELMAGKIGTTAIVAPFGENINLTANDLKIDMEMTSDIGLIGRIVDSSRILGARGIAIPEDSARFLECAVDKLLRMNGSTHLILDISNNQRVHGASMMFNALQDLIGAEAIQEALDNETPLSLTTSQMNDVNQFASALVAAAKKGDLTIDDVLNEARSCNLITNEKKGDQWTMR